MPDYVWDEIRPELVSLFTDPWSQPILGPNRRQKTVVPFGVRAMRRVVALDSLFTAGLYWESHPLVRSAYEDWLELAYLLREPRDDRIEEFKLDVHRHDARLYDTFTLLCGQGGADAFFGSPPPDVALYVGLPRAQTNPPSFAALADDVGLRPVHDFVYTYLSARSHPTGRIRELFDDSASIPVAQIPARNSADETRLVLWTTWFTARIAVLATREFGIDREPFCEWFLSSFPQGPNLETCVFVREYERLKLLGDV